MRKSVTNRIIKYSLNEKKNLAIGMVFTVLMVAFAFVFFKSRKVDQFAGLQGDDIFRNIQGNKLQPIFAGGVNYFK